VLGVQRHLLDEPELVTAVQAESQQRASLVVVDAAHQHGIHLDRGQSGIGCGAEPGQYVGQPVAPGQREEGLAGQGVQGHVEPVQPGRGQWCRQQREADAVGSQRDLRPWLQPRGPGDDGGQSPADERLAARKPDLGDAEQPDRDGDQPG
jgi:hypothetical protein